MWYRTSTCHGPLITLLCYPRATATFRIYLVFFSIHKRLHSFFRNKGQQMECSIKYECSLLGLKTLRVCPLSEKIKCSLLCLEGFLVTFQMCSLLCLEKNSKVFLGLKKPLCMYVCVFTRKQMRCAQTIYGFSTQKGEIDLCSLEKQLITQIFAACRYFGPGPAIDRVYVEG